MEQPLFGDTLRALLQEKPVRALARAIHVEHSVVYRWLRNERVPQLNTDHVANIAKHLRLDPRAVERLKQAQITSLTQLHTSIAPHMRAPRANRHAAVNQFLEQTQTHPDPPSAQQFAASASARVLPQVPRSTTLHGVGAILQAAIEVIEHAQPDPLRGNATILLLMQGEELFAELPSASGLERAWRQALGGALRRGWKIEQLWRLNRDVSRSLHIVKSMLDLVGIGGYHPRYFDRYGLLWPPYEMVIVPGSAAILLLASESPVCADGALVLTGPADIALMSAHYRQVRSHTRPLLQGYLPETQELEVTRALVSAEAKPGGRLLVKGGPSALTHPPTWLREDSILSHYTRRSGLVSDRDLPEYMREQRQRLALFEIQVQRYDYLDICPQEAIRQLCDTGQYHPDIPFYGLQVPLEVRLEHLQRLIFMLQSQDRYHLALLDEYETESLPVEPTRNVAGNSDVFVMTTPHDASNKLIAVHMHITEPTIVAAFREHFADTWERIAPRHKQKSDVITWLEQQVQLLQQRMGVEVFN